MSELYKALDLSQRNFINETLTNLPFVKWDRYVFADPEWFSVFGWIDRKKDAYKDFVVLVFDLVRLHVDHWHTSSAKFSRRINGLMDTDHIDCQKVEDWMIEETPTK